MAIRMNFINIISIYKTFYYHYCKNKPKKRIQFVICYEIFNFVKKIDNTTFSLRTYERVVEDETLACGTGATAVAIAMNATGQTNSNEINLNVEGGKLAVSFDKVNEKYTNVFLKGPAEFVFKGTIEI